MHPDHNPSPHILVTLIGDIQSEPFARVKYGYLIQALEKRYTLTVRDATLCGLSRIWNGLQTFHPDIHKWKNRFYQNVSAFHTRTKLVENSINKSDENYDLIFQVGVLYDATSINSEIPCVVYTDYTSHLARNKPGLGRMPMNDGMYKEWFELEKGVFHRAAHIFTRGSIVRQSVMDHYGIPAEKVTAVGGGVNLDTFPAQRQRVKNDSPVILFIGKEFYRKGGDVVLDAFREVKEVIPDARLLMLTELPTTRFALPAGVSLVPPTWDREIISNLFDQADCFVLASRLETWGDVLLEAMAYHLPCIGVSGESMEDIIEDQKTGYIVPAGDAQSLALTLTELLKDPDRIVAMGNAGYERVRQLFTWDHVVNRMIPKIDHILNQRSIDKN